MTQDEAPVAGNPGWRATITRPRVTAALVGLFILLIGWQHGGYELPVTGEIALLAAWLVLIGAILGVIPAVPLRGPRLAAVAALGGFLVWDLASVSWSHAAGRTVATAVQIGAVFSVLLAAAVTLRAEDREPVLAGVLIGIAGLALLATGSRLHPDWFPATNAVGQLGRLRPRLYWPIGYWNALAYLAGMGLPIAVAFASNARKGISRALAGASVPLLAVTVLFAISRGGVAVAVMAVLLGFVLGPIDLKRIVGLASAAATSGVVVAAALGGPQLMDGITDSGPGVKQARTTLLILVAASLAMASLAVALQRIPARDGSDRPRTRPWLRLAVSLGAAALVVGAFFAAGGGPKLDKAFRDFRNPHMSVAGNRANSVDRLASQNSNGRWELWKGAIQAGDAKPLTGNGGGTFELWWTKHRLTHLSVRNAHSLYLEAYSDLGWIGVLMIAALIGSLLAGCVSGLRRAGPSLGAAGAGTATVVAFAVSSAVDWGWQVTVLPAAALLAFSAVAAPDRELDGEAPKAARAVLGVIAVLLLALVVPPTVASHSLVDSRKQAVKGRFADSVGAARSARNWQPYSAEAWLQEGMAEEARGNVRAAEPLVRGAIKREPGGWQGWLVLAGIEAKLGRNRAALADYRKARDLNPTSPLFQVGN